MSMSASNYVAHLEKCHRVFFNVMCLNINAVEKMKLVAILSNVLSSFNCVPFNSPCNCVACNAIYQSVI